MFIFNNVFTPRVIFRHETLAPGGIYRPPMTYKDTDEERDIEKCICTNFLILFSFLLVPFRSFSVINQLIYHGSTYDQWWTIFERRNIFVQTWKGHANTTHTQVFKNIVQRKYMTAAICQLQYKMVQLGGSETIQ